MVNVPFLSVTDDMYERLITITALHIALEIGLNYHSYCFKANNKLHKAGKDNKII